jgi:hypothetical protein
MQSGFRPSAEVRAILSVAQVNHNEPVPLHFWVRDWLYHKEYDYTHISCIRGRAVDGFRTDWRCPSEDFGHNGVLVAKEESAC